MQISHEKRDYAQGKIIPENIVSNAGVFLCNIMRFYWTIILKKNACNNYMTDSDLLSP